MKTFTKKNGRTQASIDRNRALYLAEMARERQELADLHEQVICRVDAGESLEAAIEAVTGWGRGPVFDRIRNFALGIR
jgi:hypothetical protein